MSISLVFTIHNKVEWLDDLLRSWLDRLSGQHRIEVIAVFDACTDASAVVAVRALRDYMPSVRYLPLHAEDIFEIRCNNRALERATGDIIVMAQDDCWMYDQNWDDTLTQAVHAPLPVGAVGLLAGVNLNPAFGMTRIECYREHKHEGAWVHGIAQDAYPLGLYEVNAINRPFAIRTDLLRQYGGMDEAYCPMDFDDLDLSLKLLRDGYTNLYVPFDLVNTSAKHGTLSKAQRDTNYAHGEAIALTRWSEFVQTQHSCTGLLRSLTVREGGLVW